MNLYLISQTANSGYDTYDSAVVAADSAEEAANMDPGSGKTLAEANYSSTWVDDPAKVKVKHLGTAHGGIEAGVICASFNAG